MNKIIRMWNQNRKKIIIIALGVVFIFAIIQVLNQVAKEENQKKANNNVFSVQNYQKLPTTSSRTGEVVSEEKTKANVNIIENFVQACNNEDIKKAYDLLTDECKNTLFPTEQEFIDNYYNLIFKTKKTIDIENYKNSSKTNTYIVTFYEDSISTGNVSSSQNYGDYITVDKDTQKLNINSLITAKEINKSTEKNGIRITILKQELYKDYEIYEIKAENYTDKTVLLDTMSSSRKIYIMDNSKIKNTVAINEIADSLLQITSYGAKTMSMKFYKSYDSNSITKKVIFTDIVEDNAKYEQENTTDRLKIEVEI